MTTFAVLETWIQSLERAARSEAGARSVQLVEVLDSMKEWQQLHAGERVPTQVYTDAMRDAMRRWLHFLLILRKEFAPEALIHKKRFDALIVHLLDEVREVLGILDLYSVVLDYSKQSLKPSGN